MSSFQHNPYQQFSSPQPAPSSPSSPLGRMAAAQYNQSNNRNQHPSHSLAAVSPADARTASAPRHATNTVRVQLHSPPSRSASASSPSHNTSFFLSRDESCVASGTRGESELIVAAGSEVRTSLNVEHVRQSSFSNPRTPHSAVSPTAPAITTFAASQHQMELPWKQSEGVSTRNSGDTAPTAAGVCPYLARRAAIGFEDHVSIASGLSHMAAAAPPFPPSPPDAQTPALTGKTAATLFIDGLPPTIENQYQLCPYVPPHGRVRVRVKRSRGRDVGFAEYDSVEAAAAALEWFHTIRMLCESAQKSPVRAAPTWIDSGVENMIHSAGGDGAMTHGDATLPPLPLSFREFITTRYCPAAYASLLRQSVCLRVEWAHTPEAQHPRFPPLLGPGFAPPLSLPPLPIAHHRQELPPGHPPIPDAFHTSTTATAPPPFALPQWSGAPSPTAGDAVAAPTASWQGNSEHIVARDQDGGEKDFASATASLSQRPEQQQQQQQQWGATQEDEGGQSTVAPPPHSPISPLGDVAPTSQRSAPSFVDGVAYPIASQQQQHAFASCPVSPMRGRQERRLPSRTLFVKLTHNFPLPPSLSHGPDGEGWCDPSIDGAEMPASSSAAEASFPPPPPPPPPPLQQAEDGVGAEAPAMMSAEEEVLFTLAQQVCREDFFSEQFAGVLRYRPFLHPPYYGGCFVLFERDTDMQRCLQWMRADARLMTLFAVQPARTDTFER